MAGFLAPLAGTTIPNYALGALDGAAQHNPALKYMREDGAWEYDQSGTTLQGAVEAGFDQPIIGAPGMDLTPYLKTVNRYAPLYSLPWAEIVGVKVVDLGLLRRNQNPKQALVKVRDKEIPAMFNGMLSRVDGLLHQFLNQNISSPTQVSGTTVTGLPIAGLPSFLLAPGSAGLNGFNGLSTYTGIAVAATDIEAVAGAQTYAGLPLVNSGITGVDNVVADAWTPTLVNTTSTVWNGSATASASINFWLQHMANRMRRFSAANSDLRPDPMRSGWLSFDHFENLGKFLATKQTIYVQDKAGPKTTQPGLGTDGDALPHAGLMWNWDERMPAATAYIIPWKQVMSFVLPLFRNMDGNGNPLMDDQTSGNPLGRQGEDAGIIEAVSTMDPVRRQWIVTGTIPMQIVCMPRYFARAGAYA